MKVTVESTDEFRKLDGRYYRVWRGTDSKGQSVVLIVRESHMMKNADMTEAARDLRTVPMTGFEQMIVCTKKDIGPVEESDERREGTPVAEGLGGHADRPQDPEPPHVREMGVDGPSVHDPPKPEASGDLDPGA